MFEHATEQPGAVRALLFSTTQYFPSCLRCLPLRQSSAKNQIYTLQSHMHARTADQPEGFFITKSYSLGYRFEPCSISTKLLLLYPDVMKLPAMLGLPLTSEGTRGRVIEKWEIYFLISKLTLQSAWQTLY